MARTTVPAAHLDKMLKERAVLTPECERCVIGDVVEIPPDETGCNWRVSQIQGSGCFDCLAAMGDFIEGLRAQFLLEVDDDMDPTLLTTWEIQ